MKEIRTPLDAAGLTAHDGRQVVGVRSREVRQRVTLHVAPQAFDRVEFGSVGRKPFHMKPRAATSVLTDDTAPMDIQMVPDEEDRAG